MAKYSLKTQNGYIHVLYASKDNRFRISSRIRVEGHSDERIQIQNVMKMSGHTDFRGIKPYIAVSKEHIKKISKKWDI